MAKNENVMHPAGKEKAENVVQSAGKEPEIRPSDYSKTKKEYAASSVHPLPPYPTEEQQNEVVFDEMRYDGMREAFEIINNKSYKKMPSYDCNKAKTEVEKLICSNETLSELDAKMALLHEYMQDLYDLELTPSRGHLEWLKARNNFECKPKIENKTDCLISLYELKISSQLAVIFMQQLYAEDSIRNRENQKNKKLNRYWFDLFLSQGFSVNFRGDFLGSQVDYLGGSCPVFVRMRGIYHPDYFTYALDHGADVNLQNRYCPPVLFYASRDADVDKILEMGADVNAVSGSGEPLLVHRTDLAEKILPLGADPNKANEYDGETPLMRGAYWIKANYLPAYIKLLVRYGADITAKNKEGKTAYDVLVETYDNPKVYEDRRQELKLTDDEMNKYLDEAKKLLRN